MCRENKKTKILPTPKNNNNTIQKQIRLHVIRSQDSSSDALDAVIDRQEEIG